MAWFDIDRTAQIDVPKNREGLSAADESVGGAWDKHLHARDHRARYRCLNCES